jgi:hyperosmotically inducible protein
LPGYIDKAQLPLDWGFSSDYRCCIQGLKSIFMERIIVTHRILKFVVAACFCCAFVPSVSAYAQNPPATWSGDDTTRIVNEVQKRLGRVTTYSVFDDINFTIKGKTIVLNGSASRPIVKSDAGNALKGISGVDSVDNQMEVLPLSPNDDRIRAGVYNAIFTAPSLSKYNANAGRVGRGVSVARMAGGITNDPPIGFHAIHIIVKNGNVTLKGAVLNSGDSSIAEIKANGVSGVFSVTNQIGIESSGSGK